MVEDALPAGFALRSLRAFGFEGFLPVATLRRSECADVPARSRDNGRMQAGVYVTFRESAAPPQFLSVNPCGRWRGDLTHSVDQLAERWVPGSHIVYIGKADATDSNCLRRRVSAYIRFGAGANARHAGGYRTWQLSDAADLLVAWLVVGGEAPVTVESRLIEAHAARYGRKPFANGRLSG